MSGFSRRILLVTLEPIARQMAGPAIRCVEIGKELARDHEVTVFSPCPSDIERSSEICDLPNFNIFCGGSKANLYKLAQNSDIIFVQANVLKPYPALSDMGKYLVVDLYDPYLLSLLAQYANDKITSASSYSMMHQVLQQHMLAADFSICASEKQLDYWLGRFCAVGRLSPELYSFDPTLRKLIDVVPFGLPDSRPERTGTGMKGNVSGINQTDFVLLWGGGIWDWFDPLTVIRAVSELSDRFPQLKLYFSGWKSPNPQVPLMEMAVKARDEAEKLGSLNRSIFFSEGWTPYNERVNYLLDADAAVSAHFDLPETRFSFRTRILDYFWTGRPILTTTGDHLADLIERRQAGVALPYQDVQAWQDAIATLLTSKDHQQRFAANSQSLAEEFKWSKTVDALRKFCAEPYHLPQWRRIRMPSLVERARAVYSRGGKDLVMRKSQEIIRDLIRG